MTQLLLLSPAARPCVATALTVLTWPEGGCCAPMP